MTSKVTATANENGTEKANGDARRLNITAASEYLETSRNTVWRVIKQYKVKTFANPLDMRETLVLQDDLDRIKNLLQPKKARRRLNKRASLNR